MGTVVIIVDEATVELELQKRYETTTIRAYKALTTAQYITDAQIQKLVDATKDLILPLSSTKERLIASIMIMNGTMSLAIKFKSYDSYERRFSIFYKKFSEIIAAFLGQIKNEKPESDFQQWIDETLFFYYFKYVSIRYSPFHSLLRSWLLLETSIEKKQMYYSLLLNQLNEQTKHRSFTLLTSLMALSSGDGARSLQLLKSQHDIEPHDLVHHFELFKTQQDWETMKRWFTLFMSHWQKKSLGPLQRLYNEMLENTGGIDDITNVWNKWLQRPSFQSYLSAIERYNAMQREYVLNHILPVLKSQTSLPYGEQLYLKILQHEQRFDDGITYLLKHEYNPVGLHPEKQAFVQSVKKQRPELLLPLYHQFIIRLIERKSRTHYEEAVYYMKELLPIYKERQEEELYLNYFMQMKSTYKTYRALLQEMKKIELHL